VLFGKFWTAASATFFNLALFLDFVQNHQQLLQFFHWERLFSSFIIFFNFSMLGISAVWVDFLQEVAGIT
jgi:hypothetical protein